MAKRKPKKKGGVPCRCTKCSKTWASKPDGFLPLIFDGSGYLAGECAACGGRGARRSNPALVLAPGAISFSTMLGAFGNPPPRGRAPNPIYPVRTPSFASGPPAGFVDAPDMFGADARARALYGPSATIGVAYPNLERARAREVTCGCQHGTTPQGYPWYEPCAQHRAVSNKRRPPSRGVPRSNPHCGVVHRVKTKKSKKAVCGATDGNASLRAAQVTCPGCCGKKRKNPKGKRKNSPPARYDRDLLMSDVDGLADAVRHGDTLDEAYLKTLALVMRDAGLKRRDLTPGDVNHWERALWDQILNASNGQVAAYIKHRERVINA